MKLTKLQKRYLARRMCSLCEQRLDQDWCGAIYEKCTAQQMQDRRTRCLAEYKPRKPIDSNGFAP